MRVSPLSIEKPQVTASMLGFIVSWKGVRQLRADSETELLLKASKDHQGIGI